MVERKLRSHTPKVRSEKIKRSLLKSTRMFQQHHKQWSTEWVGDRSHTLLKGREMFCNSHSRKKLASIHIHAWLYVNTWVVFKFIFERVVQRQRWGLEYYNKTSEFNATAAERMSSSQRAVCYKGRRSNEAVKCSNLSEKHVFVYRRHCLVCASGFIIFDLFTC